jgi:trans-aconitate 2-methyltransferase
MDKWDSKQYKEHSKPQKESGLDAINNFSFKGDESILDIGCGDGKTTIELAKKVPNGKVIGIDPSSNMIDECKKNYSLIKNISFEQKGAEEFSFDIKFDLIVSFFALHYVNDQLTVLKNIYNALKPRGKLIIRMSGGEQKEIAEVFNREPWKSIFAKQEEKWHSQTEEDYKKLLKEAGFKDFKAKTESHPRYFTKDEFFNWAMAWVPYVTGLDQKKSIEFTNELLENISKGQEGEGKIKMASPILYVDAIKS